MVMLPVRGPIAVGLKTTSRWQLWPMAKVELQVLVSVKSPLGMILAICNAALPVFLIYTGLELLAVPTAFLPNFRLLGKIVASGLWISKETVLSVVLTTARSRRPSPLKSPTA